MSKYLIYHKFYLKIGKMSKEFFPGRSSTSLIGAILI
jgi:hypothetical protein